MAELKKDKLAAPASGKKTTPAKAVLAGGTAGAIEAVIMFPTEFVKTQLQLQSKTNPKYTGIINCATITVKENGFFGLYRGLSVLLIGSVPKSAIRFTGFEVFANLLRDEKGNITAGRTFLAGLCAGLSEAVLAVTPMETIKTRLIHDQNSPPDQRKYKGLLHGTSTIFKQEGIAGIYKGLFPTMLKQSTNQATRFLVFGELKKLYQGGDPAVALPVWASATFGGLAGAASVFVNNPIDVVKTKMQGLEAVQYKNSFHCAKEILMKQGPLFFYSGAVPRLARVCGDAAIVFTVYERLVDFFTDLEKKLFK